MTERIDIEQTADQLRAVLDELAGVVGAISPGQQDGPTPCTEHTVSQLRDHVLGWLTTFADGFADPGGQAPRTSTDGYQAPDDPRAEVTAAAGRMDQALRAG